MSRRIVYGIHPVEELLGRRGATVQLLWLVRPERLSKLQSAAEARAVQVQQTSTVELDELCGSSSHQGVAAVVGEFDYLEIEDLIENQARPPLLLVLDSVTDPQNLGAIFRSGLVLGASGLVLPKDRAASVTPVVVRVSAGATEHLPCARVTNLCRALEQCKAAGLWTVGAVERGGQLPEEVDFHGPTALVLGSEHKGIRPLVLRSCDLTVTIPSAAGIASLNVASAGTALLAEAARQRRAAAR